MQPEFRGPGARIRSHDGAESGRALRLEGHRTQRRHQPRPLHRRAELQCEPQRAGFRHRIADGDFQHPVAARRRDPFGLVDRPGVGGNLDPGQIRRGSVRRPGIPGGRRRRQSGTGIQARIGRRHPGSGYRAGRSRHRMDRAENCRGDSGQGFFRHRAEIHATAAPPQRDRHRIDGVAARRIDRELGASLGVPNLPFADAQRRRPHHVEPGHRRRRHFGPVGLVRDRTRDRRAHDFAADLIGGYPKPDPKGRHVRVGFVLQQIRRPFQPDRPRCIGRHRIPYVLPHHDLDHVVLCVTGRKRRALQRFVAVAPPFVGPPSDAGLVRIGHDAELPHRLRQGRPGILHAQNRPRRELLQRDKLHRRGLCIGDGRRPRVRRRQRRHLRGHRFTGGR